MFPLTGFGSLTGYHRYTTADPFTPSLACRPCLPLPKFLPLRRFPSLGEPPNSRGFHTVGYVAPSGFRTLSTPCSLQDLPGLFHPGPTLGVNPSRPCSSSDAGTFFRKPLPPGFAPFCAYSEESVRHGRPARDCHIARSPPTNTGVQPDTRVACLLGLFSSRVSWFHEPELRITTLRPLTHFIVQAFMLTHPLVPQGIPLAGPQPHSLEPGATPMEF
jgi:hypothetical protein